MVSRGGVESLEGAEGLEGTESLDDTEDAEGLDGVNILDGVDGVDGVDSLDGVDGVEGVREARKPSICSKPWWLSLERISQLPPVVADGLLTVATLMGPGGILDDGGMELLVRSVCELREPLRGRFCRSSSRS